MGMTSTLSIAASVELSKALDLSSAHDQMVFRRSVQLADGAAAGQADVVFHDRRTLAASAAEDIDLSGALVDALGDAVAFVRVKGLFISAAAANTTTVVVGAAGANGWATFLNTTGTLTLRPGACVGAFAGPADATGYVVTPATGDLLHVANGGANEVIYDVVVIGASV